MKEISFYPVMSNKDDMDLVVITKANNGYPLHWHDFFEIEVVIGGKGINVLNGKKYPIERGSAYLLKPVDCHEIIAEEEIRVRSVTFRERMLNETMLLSVLHSEQRKDLRLDGAALETVLTAISLLESEMNMGGEYGRQLLEYLVHFFIEKKAGGLNPQQLSGINKALVYLEFHFREPVRLNTLAREAGFNPTYFSEIFKKTTGETYTQRLACLRLEYAATLLSGGYSVSYACYESGFGSLSNFFTAFKRKYGVGPKEYARAAQTTGS